MKPIKHSLSGEKLLLARLKNFTEICKFSHRIVFTHFLNEREVYFATQFLKGQKEVHFCFFGGYAHSERKVLCVFSLSVDNNEIEFPISCFQVSYPNQYELGHRDFLGALMGLNLKRELIGDIVVANEGGIAHLFVHQNATYIVETELDKIGRIGVQVTETAFPQLGSPREKTEEKTVVASMRLDCIVGALAKVSREKANDLIRQGLIFLNYEEAQKSSKQVEPGDILTIRGQGKFAVGDISGTSRKGKLHLQYLKYS